MHKTANVLNRVATSVPPAMKQDLREIRMVPDRETAETWRRLQGENRLPKVVYGVTFRDGIEVIEAVSQNAA